MRTMAGYAVALEAGHEAGDYWVQTDHQAANKGKEGVPGIVACVAHVATYTVTQAVCVAGAAMATGHKPKWGRVALGLAVSAITHYAADRREYGLMYPAARALPGKERFLKLGTPREPMVLSGSGRTITDNPTLGTGAWALDQAWHKVLGVFVPALIMASGDREHG